ncbi:MAG: tetratricopeptide repeat protein [bacterium]|nr:tetratricopeptide repeat protein [bacterium]
MMPLWCRSASVLVFLLCAAAVRAACPEPAALPDTAGFAVEVATLRALPPEARAALAARAAAACEPWVGEFRARDGKVARSLDVVFSRGCLSRWRTGLHGSQLLRPNDQLVTAHADFTAALAADPCCLTALVARGLVRKAAGEPRAAIADWSRALRLLEDADVDEADKDAAAMCASLRRTAGWALALACSRLGMWEQAETAVTMMVGRQGRRPDGPEALIHGLCLAGSGRTAEAIDWTVRMPPIEYRHTSSLSAGYKATPGAFANDWIRSQALLADGDFAGARWALGDIDDRRFHNLPLADVYWQDAGLVCELAGDRDAGRCYERAHSRAPLWFARPTKGTTAAPIVLGFPAAGVPFFTTGDGAFAGGSPFGFLARQMALAVEEVDPAAREKARLRALECCEMLVRRNLRPDIVRALRARLYLAAGCAAQAGPDLQYAHDAFAVQGVIDPGTSLLLGQLELAARRPERARELFGEAVGAAPESALNWRALGVALSEAGQYAEARSAMEKALALEPDSMEGWYNLGVLDWKQGDGIASLAHLEKAWSLDPGNERVQYMLQTVATARRTPDAGSGAQSEVRIDEGP